MENKKQLLKIGGIVGFVIAGIYTLIIICMLMATIFYDRIDVVDYNSNPYHYSTDYYNYNYNFGYNSDMDFAVLIFVIGIFVLITVPVYIGSYKFLKYSRMDEIETKQNSIMVWSIVLLLLSCIPGILGLIACFTNSNKISSSFANELKDLNKLKDDGLITEDEYNKKKKKILDI